MGLSYLFLVFRLSDEPVARTTSSLGRPYRPRRPPVVLPSYFARATRVFGLAATHRRPQRAPGPASSNARRPSLTLANLPDLETPRCASIHLPVISPRRERTNACEAALRRAHSGG